MVSLNLGPFSLKSFYQLIKRVKPLANARKSKAVLSLLNSYKTKRFFKNKNLKRIINFNKYLNKIQLIQRNGYKSNKYILEGTMTAPESTLPSTYQWQIEHKYIEAD